MGTRGGEKNVRLPRPRLRRIGEVIRELEAEAAKGNGGDLSGFDGKLAEAALADAAEYAGEVVSAVERQCAGPGVNRWRKGNLFTCMGWTRAEYPYYRDKARRGKRFGRFGVERNMTRTASENVSRLGVLLGSFPEARDTLARLGLGKLSVSKVRAETLARGEEAYEAMKSPAWDARQYPEKDRKLPEGARPVPRTLLLLVDGTNVPATKADTRGHKGKQGGEAKTRQLRVVSLCEYEAVTEKGRPIPLPGSFSYGIMAGDALELKGFVKKLAEARGAGQAARMQCGADGEEALESILTDAFPRAVFFNDIMHAMSYLSAACRTLGIAEAEKEERICRAILKRNGAASVVDRLRRLYPQQLAASEEAAGALDYLDKRRAHMNYGWLRKNGFYIGTSHVEAAARLLVARRCKQAGMHWRLENAARVCALLARIRSAPRRTTA